MYTILLKYYESNPNIVPNVTLHHILTNSNSNFLFEIAQCMSKQEPAWH